MTTEPQGHQPQAPHSVTRTFALPGRPFPDGGRAGDAVGGRGLADLRDHAPSAGLGTGWAGAVSSRTAVVPAGGHVADRFDRRHVLLACYSSFALCSLALLAITLRGLHGVAPVYAVLVALGFVRVFNGPAGQAFSPLLVPAADLSQRRRLGLVDIQCRDHPWTGDRRRALRSARERRLRFTLPPPPPAAGVLADARHPHPGSATNSRGRDWNTVIAGFQYVWRNC